MSAKFGIVFLILASGLQAFGQSLETKNEVKTAVDLRANVTQLWKVSHPAKLWKCWGRPSKVDYWGSEAGTSVRENEGTLGQPIYSRATKPGFGEFIPQTANWAAKLSADREFSVTFAQNIQEGTTSYINHKCNTQRFSTITDTVSNSFTSTASFEVPPGVSLLMVKRPSFSESATREHSLTSTIKNVYPVLSGAQEAGSVSSEFKSEEYFFVEPGQRVDFTVNWASQSKENASFTAKFELRLLGAEKCEVLMWDPNEALSEQARRNIETRISKEYFQKDPAKAIEVLACLRNKTYIDSLMQSTNGQDLTRFLESINRQVRELNRGDDSSGQVTAYTTVASLALYKMSSELLGDLKPYCEVKSVTDILGTDGKTVQIRGFSYIAREFARVQYLFDETPVLPLRTLVNALKELKNSRTTYAEFSTPENIDALRELQYSIFKKPFRLFEVALNLSAKLPEIKTGAISRRELNALLSQGSYLTNEVEADFKVLAQNFARKSNTIVDPTELEKSLAKYERSLALALPAIQAELRWFAAPEGSILPDQFRKDLRFVNQRIMGSIAETLNDQRGAVYKKIGVLEIDKARELWASIHNCLEAAND